MTQEGYVPKHSSRKQPEEVEEQQEIQVNEALGAESQRGSSLEQKEEIPDTTSFKLENNCHTVNHIFHSSQNLELRSKKHPLKHIRKQYVVVLA